MTTKHLVWVGTSRADIRALPEDARRQLGFDLREVQAGGLPADWKPMSAVGPGVVEIRVRAGGAFRLMYIAKFVEAIYVLHVFQKKSQKTSPLDLAVAQARLAAVRRARRGG
ncbi:MAG: type II toxin-antitoxin system RelE/ParE family toxin [Gemmatimonadaceae bacterium]